MPSKSLIQRYEINTAVNAHNCQANARHRLTRGDTRLRVHDKRSYVHYCQNCAVKIVEQDIEKLQSILKQLQ